MLKGKLIYTLKDCIKRFIAILLYGSYVYLIAVYAQVINPVSKINQEKQRTWIKNSLEYIKQISVQNEWPVIKPNVTDIEIFSQISYRLNGNCFIGFDNSDRIILFLNSSYTDNGIGDITIAVDNRVNTYDNGGIINLIGKKKVSIETAADFTNQSVNNTKSINWKNLNCKNALLKL